MENLNKMKEKIVKTLRNTECKDIKINGVSNLSIEDLENALMRIDILNSGNKYRLLPVKNKVRELFESYNINPEENNVYKYL